MRSFLRSEGGNIAIMTALLLPVLLAGVGLAVDYGTLAGARAELQNSTDAAVLAAAQDLDSDARRREVFNNILRTNVAPSLTLAKAELEVDDGLNYVGLTGTATAKVNLFFLDHLGERTVSVKASTFQSTKSIAISLVLDNTGSMAQAGINALKKASHALVNAVESNGGGRKDILLSVVPFVTAVNIKAEGFDESWIDKDGRALYNGWNFLNDELRQRRRNGERLQQLPEAYAETINGKQQACNNQGANHSEAAAKRALCVKQEIAKAYPHSWNLFELSGTSWKGCVEARPAPYNLDTTTPSASMPDTLFVPFFAPDEPGVIAAANSGGNDDHQYNNSWLADLVTGRNNDETQRNTVKYVNPDAKLVEESKNITRGPNRSCPTPLTPLTSDIAKVRAGIDAMKFWNGSGTNIAEGLAWGWRVMSPNAPYPKDPAVRTTDLAKYIVLMTDGRNVSYGGKSQHNRSDYGSYGYQATGRVAGLTETGKVETKLNDWTQQMCTQIKKEGVEIFTVVYNEKAASVQTMFKNCASKAANFHMADNTVALEQAFAKIGSDISMLRLTQ